MRSGPAFRGDFGYCSASWRTVGDGQKQFVISATDAILVRGTLTDGIPDALVRTRHDTDSCKWHFDD